MKSDTLGFSFGYLVLDEVKRVDGVREIRRLDVFEVSATPVPMNGATRVLSAKSATAKRDPALDRETRAIAEILGRPLEEVEAKAATREAIKVAVFDC